MTDPIDPAPELEEPPKLGDGPSEDLPTSEPPAEDVEPDDQVEDLGDGDEEDQEEDAP